MVCLETLKLSTACLASGPALTHHSVVYVMLLDEPLRNFLLAFVSHGIALSLTFLGSRTPEQWSSLTRLWRRSPALKLEIPSHGGNLLIIAL